MVDLTTPLDGDGVPEKFRGKSLADVLKSYGELESRLGQSAPAPESQPNRGFESAPLGGIPMMQQQSPFDPYIQEIERTGGLSDASRYELQQRGVNAPTIDIFVEGAKARTRETLRSTYEAAGGEEQYKAMMVWAGSLPPAQQQAFNDALASPNPGARELAVKGLQAQYVAANGQPPSSPLRAGSAPSGGPAFGSLQEMHAAQRDPKYATNEDGFRDAVMDKAAAAAQAGVEGFQ